MPKKRNISLPSPVLRLYRKGKKVEEEVEIRKELREREMGEKG
jgi:hypothetical protein